MRVMKIHVLHIDFRVHFPSLEGHREALSGPINIGDSIQTPNDMRAGNKPQMRVLNIRSLHANVLVFF
jgi:hypothetical protein